jgi:prepilin-type processing-associated H-X9-DG protein
LTLVEFLVVIAIIGVLAGLLLPAIQHARETAHRTQCANQLKQIGVALQLHQDARGVIPNNGGWDGTQTIANTSGTQFTPSTTDFQIGNQVFHWGIGDARHPPDRQGGSWLFAILPYVEQQAIYDAQSWTEPVTTYVCPSRRRVVAYEVVSPDACGAYEGGGWRWGKTDYAGNALLMPGLTGVPAGRCESLQGVSDGLSNTLLAGEKAFDRSVQTETSWYWDEPFFLGGSAGTARNGVAVMRDEVGISYRTNWGSAHPGAAQFLLCDGSVQAVGYDVTWEVFSALLTPRSGD